MSNEKNFMTEVLESDFFQSYQKALSKLDKAQMIAFYSIFGVCTLILVAALCGVISMGVFLGAIAIFVVFYLVSFKFMKGVIAQYQMDYEIAKKRFIDESYELLLRRNKNHPDLTPSSPSALYDLIEVFKPCNDEFCSRRFELFMSAMDNAAKTNTKGFAYNFIVSDSFKEEFKFFFPSAVAITVKMK